MEECDDKTHMHTDAAAENEWRFGAGGVTVGHNAQLGAACGQRASLVCDTTNAHKGSYSHVCGSSFVCFRGNRDAWVSVRFPAFL